MRGRTPGRWLAPVALVVCAIAIYAIVHAGSSSSSKSSSGAPATSTPATARKTRTAAKAKPAKPKTYTVQSGDVLTAIAAKTGVTVAELQTLNPSVDAQVLRVGQKLRLSR